MTRIEDTALPSTRPRQSLSERQSLTVAALLDAGLTELGDVGYDKLTIRAVAQRAGVTHTTAYSYFTSKAHLISELYWRQMQSLPPPEIGSDETFVGRVRAAVEAPAAMLTVNPALARSIFVSILSDEPDVRRLRGAVARVLIDRFRTALGPFDDPEVVDTLFMAYSGAMMFAGTGNRDFLEVVPRMETVARLIDAD
jgi:TetR/AcrR family transcriptional regulator, cholesterol catabolism regulator